MGSENLHHPGDAEVAGPGTTPLLKSFHTTVEGQSSFLLQEFYALMGEALSAGRSWPSL